MRNVDNNGYFNVWISVTNKLNDMTLISHSVLISMKGLASLESSHSILTKFLFLLLSLSITLPWFRMSLASGWSVRIKLMEKNSIKEKYFTGIAWISDPAPGRYGDHKFHWIKDCPALLPFALISEFQFHSRWVFRLLITN